MVWQYHPLIVVFFVSGFVALGVAVYSWHYIRRYDGTTLVIGVGVLGLANSIWIFAAALKTASSTLELKLLFYKLEFLGSWVAPSLAVVVALAYLGWNRWLTTKTLAVLALFPLVGIALTLLNPGSVMLTEPILVPAQGIQALEHAFPPLFVLYISWGLGAASVAAVLFAYGAINRVAPWKPSVIGALVFTIPVVVISLKLGGIYPPGGQGINSTPAANGIALGFLAIAVVRYRFLELVPIGRYRAVECMPYGYILVDSDGTVLDANRAALDLLSDGEDTALENRSIGDCVPFYDELSSSSSSETRQFETAGRMIEVRTSRVSEPSRRAGQLLLLQDVTDRLERQRNLERNNERLDKFAGMLSHDLRNPLGVAKGRLRMAREDVESPHFDPIEQAHDRMQDLIDDALILAREGERVSETEPVALASLSESAWANVMTGHATLVIETEAVIRADVSRLQRLLENLFRNAVQHGGDDVTVTVGECPEGFSVQDDGPGLPQADREDVFETGYSTTDEGTGFGLSIVEEIVQAHGWRIEVTDEPTGGARFEITGVVRDRR